MGTTKIKCPVEGIIDLDRLKGISADQTRDIINSREFQRLRHIAQLGFSQYVYPGANHSRLSHSLGAFQGCQKALIQLESSRVRIPDEWHDATALAALLHDIGHGPFSHSFEKVSREDHEERTYEIIEQGPELPAILRQIDIELPKRIIQVLKWNIPSQNNRFLSFLVNSQLDCDRLDYLRRDSLHSGAGYGNFDRDWILRAFQPSPDHSSLVISEKGRHAIEQYLIARFHMYQCVYFHKTTRSFECSFQGMCNRLRKMRPADLGNLINLPEIKALGIAGTEAISLADYLNLTDFSYLHLLRNLAEHNDPTVRLLAKSIIRRKPFGCEELEASARDEQDLMELPIAREKIEENEGRNLDPECVVQIDDPSDTPYKTYERDSSQPDKGIRVISDTGQIDDITIKSNLVREMVSRYYIRRVFSEAMTKIVEKEIVHVLQS